MLFVITIVVLIFILYFILNRKYDYWKIKNIPNLKPLPFVGNFLDLWMIRTTMPEVERSICQQLPDEPIIGAYYGTEPCLIVQDPSYIKTITTKDFYYFSNREVSEHVYKELLTKNLFQAYGDEWKVLRQNLTPVFSSAKMKKMFHLIEQCSKTFEKILNKETKEVDVFEMRHLMGRFTMDCIGSCAFGINTRALEDSNKSKNPFRKIAELVFDVPPSRFFKIHTRAIWPGIFYALGFKVTPKQVSDFFTKLILGVFKERAGVQSTRNDFIDLVMNFSKSKSISGDSMKNFKSNGKQEALIKVDDDLISAQCFLFFGAGFETSATTSSFVLYELAKKQDIQENVRKEIDDYLHRHNNVLGYECVTELPYLEQCIDETLRLYPVLGVITREVVEPYTFSDSGLTVEKGMRIHLPVFHIQRNPKYFPNPEEFIPERFSPENKKNIVPYSYFPFGEGPRICIGEFFFILIIIIY